MKLRTLNKTQLTVNKLDYQIIYQFSYLLIHQFISFTIKLAIYICRRIVYIDSITNSIYYSSPRLYYYIFLRLFHN